MSNLGMYKAMAAHGMTSVKTKVGDRYVVEEMLAGGYNLGGEQSGHIVFLDFNTTGDGMLTSLQLLHIMKETGKKLSELAEEVKDYPQALVNVKVADKKKLRWRTQQLQPSLIPSKKRCRAMVEFLFARAGQSRSYE